MPFAGSQTSSRRFKSCAPISIKKRDPKVSFLLVGTRGLLCALLELHRRSYASGVPAFFRPPFAGSQTSSRRFKSCAPISIKKETRRSFFLLVGTRGLLCALLELHRRSYASGVPAFFRPPFAGSQTSSRRFKSCAPISIKKETRRSFFYWSGREDSNLRPLAPHANALPGCATSRIIKQPH